MKGFDLGRIGRVVVISFEPGDLFLEGIRSELSRFDIKNGVVISAIGTFSKATIHRVTTTDFPAVEEFLTFEEPMELSSVDGVIIDGHIHLHMVFSGLEKTYSGHLEDGCEILYLGEVVIGELIDMDNSLARTKNNFGINMITRIE